MKKIGLALGSGGARGFCHIGVLQAFEEHNIPIHCIAGCSHGALVGGCYAAGVSVEKMKEVSAKSTMKAIMDLNISCLPGADHRGRPVQPGAGRLSKRGKSRKYRKKAYR